MLRLVTVLFATGFIAGASQAEPAVPPSEIARVTLLGTSGGPAVRRTRSQPASLLQVGGKAYLIDTGDGVLRQLATIGVHPNEVDAVFITHLHFDHTAGLPAFMAFDLIGRRTAPVSIYGPPGTRDLVRDAAKVFQSSVDIFLLQQPHLPSFASLFQAHDIATDGPTEVYRDSAIRITAVANSHYSTMQLPRRSYGEDRSYAYRIEAGGRSFVFTGDTGPSAAVEQLARGADVLISEVIDVPAIVNLLRQRGAATAVDQSRLIEHMEKEHLTPEQVGKLANRAGVKKVVLTHFAEPLDDDGDRPAIVEAVRKEFAGEVVAGRDLLRIVAP